MSPTGPDQRRIPWLLLGLLAIGLGLAAVYYFRPPSPITQPVEAGTPLPPRTESRFLSTKAGVQYVGDQRCAECHADHCRTYAQHPMGRSLFTAADFPPLEPFEHKTNPFQDGPFRFQVARRGNEIVHREWCQDSRGNVVAEKVLPISHVVGSGAQARSYLIDNDGFLFQSPITWYQSKLQWSLSPGYEKHQNHFSRRVDSRCLYCHADQPRPVANTIHQYEKPPFGQLSIGCERCHGPGELHVATPPVGLKPGEEDLTIVNPKHLTPALRDNVCEQCHLQGEAIVVRRGRSQLDYRPGLPLHEYMSVFVRSPDLADAGKIVTHFEQMHLSACYTKSGGRFTCTSCHDPHAMPAAGENEAFYRRRCLNCHDTDRKDNNAAPACALPLAKRTANDGRDNCLACHMPRQPSSNAIHLAVTDHRVLRHPGRPGPAKAAPAASGVPLVHFHRHHLSPDDEAHTRDLGIALVELATIGQGSVQEYLVKRALPYLDKATTHAPDDVAALEARGFALYAAGQPAEALRVLADVLGRVPDREFALAWATHIADASGRVDLAEEYGRRLVARYPHYFEYQNRLAVVYVRKQNWAEAGKAARSAVRLEPFNAEARAVLISVLLATGEHVEARREFDVLGVIDPAHQARIRAWFEERIRR